MLGLRYTHVNLKESTLMVQSSFFLGLYFHASLFLAHPEHSCYNLKGMQRKHQYDYE